MRKICLLFCLICMSVILLCACNSEQVSTPAETNIAITIMNESISLLPGETVQLECSTVSENASITYSSSNTDVLTIDDQGLICGIAPGTATVSASVGDYDKAYLEVTVNKDVMTSQVGAQLNKEVLELICGLEFDLSYSVQIGGEPVEDCKAIWSSSNESVATVTDGKVYAVAPGSATITAEITANGTTVKEHCEVTVYEHFKISLSKESVSTSIGKTFSLSAKIYDANGTEIYPEKGELEWFTSDSKAISVQDGSFTVISSGTPSVGVRYKGNAASIPVGIFSITADFFKDGMFDYYGEVGGKTFSGVAFKTAAYQPYFYFSQQGIEEIRQYAEANGFKSLRIHAYAILLNNSLRINSRYIPTEVWSTADVPVSELTDDFYFRSESEGTTEVYMWFEFR